MAQPHYSWQLDPKTGDYVTVNGDAVQDTSLDVPIYIRLKTHRQGWLYAPDRFYGSTLFKNQKHNTTVGKSAVENTIFKALTPIVNDGRMVGQNITSTGRSRQGESFMLQYQQNNGDVKQVDLVEIL